MSTRVSRSRGSRVRPIALVIAGALVLETVIALCTNARPLAGWWLATAVLGVVGAALTAARAPVRDEDSATHLRSHDVESALLIERAAFEVEVLLRNGDTLYFPFDEREEAERLVARLGFAAGGRRITFLTRTPLQEVGGMAAALTLGLMWSCFHALGRGGTASIADVAVGAVWLLATWLLQWSRLRARRIVVGADVILAESAFGLRRISMASVEDARVTSKGAEVLVNGERGEPWKPISPFHDARSEALCERIRQEVAVRRTGTSTPRLARSGRSIPEWRAALRGVAGFGGYRADTVPVEQLLDLTRDAAAPIDQRIGAILAVHYADDADARSKLRIAVEALADDAERRAMLAAAEGEIDDAALDAITSTRAGANR